MNRAFVYRTFLSAVAVAVALLFSSRALAECGGNTQCIGVGATPAEAAVAHHGLGPATFTLDYGNQVITTTAGSKTIYVAAVTGPAATQAKLGSITITGTDASQFSVAGGTCLTMGPIQGGADCTILIAFTPTTLGAKSATVHVPLDPPACVGCVVERTVSATGTGTPAPPVAMATTLSVRANTPTTIDLTPLVSGANLTGIRISAAPAKGTASVSGNKVTYTPAAGYLGADAFSYETFSATATSTPAVVTVSVVARPSPAAEPHVVSLIAAQAAMAHRFESAQISNISQRLESLHRRTPSTDQARTSALSPRLQLLRQLSAQGANKAQSPLPLPETGLAQPGRAPQAEPRVATGNGKSEELGPDDPGGTQQAGAVARLLANLATTGSVPVFYQSEPAGASAGIPSGGFWTRGTVSFGKQDGTPASSAMSFTTSGVTAGYDTRVSDKLVAGVGLGYARAHAALGADGSGSNNQGRSISVYGSYQPAQDFFVDGLLGYGSLDSQSERFVAAAGSFGRSARDGDQLFGSIGGAYQYQRDALLISPYGRLEFSSGKLHKASETGAGLSSLTYFEQKLKSLRLALGLRAQSAHETDFGLAVPRVRVEYGRDLTRDGDAAIAYADMESGPTYTVAPVGTSRNSLLFGVGSELLTTSGIIAGFDFSATRRASDYTDHTVRLWLATDLDGKPKLKGWFSGMFRNPVALEAGFRWDDNVSRTGGVNTKLGDGTYFLGSGISKTISTSDHTRLKLTGALDADKFERYEKLDNLSLGLGAELQYRHDGRFGTPIYGLFARTNRDEARSAMRRGQRTSIGVNVRASVTDRIDLYGVLAQNRRNASSALFDIRDTSATLSADYQYNAQSTLYLSGEQRRGDAVSSGLPMADSAAIARVYVADDAFSRIGLVGYRYAARTTLWTLGYNLRLGNRDSLDLSWRRAVASPTQTPNYTGLTGYPGLGAPGTGGSSTYTSQQFTLSYLMRF